METPATPIYLTLEKRKAYSALIVETLCAILIYFVTLFLGIPDLTKNGMSFRPTLAFCLCAITFLAEVLIMLAYLSFTKLFKKWAYWRRKRWNNIFLFAGFTLAFGVAIALYFFDIQAPNYLVLYRFGVTLYALAALSYALKGLFSLLFTKAQAVYMADKAIHPDGLNHDNAEFRQPEDKAIKTKVDPDQVIEVDVVDKKDHSA
jgi:hypothetical protein